MGKGKGKLSVILRRTPPYANFIEFRNVRLGRLFYFQRILNSRSPRPLFITTRFNTFHYFQNFVLR